jgi:hypothetical protein
MLCSWKTAKGVVRDILERRDDVGGYIGYFGLDDWWLTVLSPEQREHIEKHYRPPGSSALSKPLTEGKAKPPFQTSASLLTAVAGQFRRRAEDRELAAQILTKAEERAQAENDMLGLHFVYQEMIRLHNRWRDTFSDALDAAFAACYKQTRIAEKVIEAWRQEYPTKPLPSHAGYEQMATMLAKQGNLYRAVDVCRQARHEGWPGNWDWRISDYMKQSGCPVTPISSTGITPLWVE